MIEKPAVLAAAHYPAAVKSPAESAAVGNASGKESSECGKMIISRQIKGPESIVLQTLVRSIGYIELSAYKVKENVIVVYFICEQIEDKILVRCRKKAEIIKPVASQSGKIPVFAILYPHQTDSVRHRNIVIFLIRQIGTRFPVTADFIGINGDIFDFIILRHIRISSAIPSGTSVPGIIRLYHIHKSGNGFQKLAELSERSAQFSF